MLQVPRWRAPLLLVAAFGAPAAAEPPPPPAPAVASAPVPALAYRSLLAGFRPFDDAATTPWRLANDQAAAIGGWRVYARESARAAAPAPAASAAVGGRSAP